VKNKIEIPKTIIARKAFFHFGYKLSRIETSSNTGARTQANKTFNSIGKES
jgi:hypothetical protein